MLNVRTLLIGSICSTFCFTTLAKASLLKPDNTDNLFNRQTHQQQTLQQQFDAKSPDVSLSTAITKTRLQFPQETPCFLINQVAVSGQDAFPHWVPIERLADQAIGHCIGVDGINLLVTDIQNRLINLNSG